jgi:hypothetical protein
MTVHIFEKWLQVSKSSVGRHSLWLLAERYGSRSSILDALRKLVREHYVDPNTTAKRLEALGGPKTAKLLQEHIPTMKKSRSGDLGEILATEVVEQHLKYVIPIRRLRWKDGREMALRGDDLIGIAHDKMNRLLMLKGESKSRANLSSAVLKEAGTALDGDRGRPTRHSVLFVAERLREQGKDALAEELEEAVLRSFRRIPVAHLLFVLTGSRPKSLLSTHLTAVAKKRRVRHAVGLRIADHVKFIKLLFGRL